jgi:hypothetical protein
MLFKKNFNFPGSKVALVSSVENPQNIGASCGNE